LSVVLTFLLVLSPLGCGSSASRDRPGKPYSSKEVRAAFAKQQLSLETFGVPEGGPVGQVLEISFSSPANTPTQDEIQFFVDVYRTSAAARSAERFFRESGFTAGRFVPPVTASSCGQEMSYFDTTPCAVRRPVSVGLARPSLI